MNYKDMTEPQLYEYCGPDARRWAEAFIQITGTEIDLNTMASWFANAMMGQYDASRSADR